MTTILIALFSTSPLWLVYCMYAQEPDTLWTRTYGGVAGDDARCIIQCLDSGYAMAGSTASWGNGGSDMCLIRINPNGDTLWIKTYGGSENDEGCSLLQTCDSGFIIAGSTWSFGAGNSDVYLVRTDNAGNALWQRTYGGVLEEHVFDVVELADRGFILAGSTRSFGAGLRDVYMIRTDSTGDTVWTRAFGGTSNDYARSLARNAVGEFLALGTTNSFGAGQGDIYLVRINAQGESLSTRAYGGPTDNQGFCIRSTSDGGYIISGTSFFSLLDYEFVLMKLDALYNESWIEFNGSLNADCAYAVRPARNSGYVYAGNFSYELYLVRTDTMGQNYWAQFYGGDYTDCAYSIQVTSDGGYIIAGVTNSFGAGDNDAYVIRIGPDPTGVAEEEKREIGPLAFSVGPNPFIKDLMIKLQLPNSKLPISLKIYDAAGRLVMQFNHLSIQPFNHVTWSGTDEAGTRVPAGIYFIELRIGDDRETRKVTLLK